MSPAPSTDLNYSRIIGRIARLIVALTAAGALIFLLLGGVREAAGFLGGAAISGTSFYLLHRLVADIAAATEGRRVRGVSIVVHAFRLIILGGATYAIVRVCGSSGRALVCGLVVAVTAAFLEVLIELFYAPH